MLALNQVLNFLLFDLASCEIDLISWIFVSLRTSLHPLCFIDFFRLWIKNETVKKYIENCLLAAEEGEIWNDALWISLS